MPAPTDRDERVALEAINQWIRMHLGIHHEDTKLDLLADRLSGLCRQEGLGDLRTLLRQLRTGDRALHRSLADAVSTNHTSFFREQKILEFFWREIVPTLPAGAPIRIWSCACSTGQEPYTLAMILHTASTASPANISMLATDISPRALATAEQGVYSEHHLRGVPASAKARFFKSVGLGQFRVSREIQAMVTFRRLNLTAPTWPFERKFQVVFCRNVLYYFDPREQREVISRLYDQVEAGGWLVTSVTESITGLGTRWRTVRPGVHRKDAPPGPEPL